MGFLENIATAIWGEQEDSKSDADRASKSNGTAKKTSRKAQHAPKDDDINRQKSNLKKLFGAEISPSRTHSPTEPDKQPGRFIAPPDKHFWLHEGGPIDSLVDLLEALGTMTDDQFRYHVNGERNDFAAWVRDVLQWSELADRIEASRSRRRMRRVIRQAIKRHQ